jgi:uncharacterized membrane protein YkvA (DUF1232 family)
MNQERSHPPQRRPDQDRETFGWLKEFFSQFELAWRLLWDERVPISAKILPLLTVAYLISPIDFLPDAMLGLGQVDDLVIFMVGLRMFISLSPPDIVAEYQRLVGRHRPEATWDDAGPEIIDLEAQMPQAKATGDAGPDANKDDTKISGALPKQDA